MHSEAVSNSKFTFLSKTSTYLSDAKALVSSANRIKCNRLISSLTEVIDIKQEKQVAQCRDCGNIGLLNGPWKGFVATEQKATVCTTHKSSPEA